MRRVTNAAEYYEAVQNIDRDKADAAIDRLPQNLNRAGKRYRTLLKEIYKKFNVLT